MHSVTSTTTNIMEKYFSSSEESSSSASSAGKDNIDNKIPDQHNQNSDSNGSSNNPGMQQSILDQPPLDRCPFCCFQAITEKEMQDHLVFHFTESAHQCQRCSIWITSVPEWYLHIQCYPHLTEDQINFKDDAVAPEHLESLKDELVKATRDKTKPPKATKNQQKEVEMKCLDCDYSTLRGENMKRHRVGHERKEEFKCDICSFSSRLKSNVTAHSIRFHREQPSSREFKCSDCEYSTFHWNNMKGHRVRHEQGGEFKCDKCSFSSRLKRIVTAHSRRYHREQPAAHSQVNKESPVKSKEIVNNLVGAAAFEQSGSQVLFFSDDAAAYV